MLLNFPTVILPCVCYFHIPHPNRTPAPIAADATNNAVSAAPMASANNRFSRRVNRGGDGLRNGRLLCREYISLSPKEFETVRVALDVGLTRRRL